MELGTSVTTQGRAMQVVRLLGGGGEGDVFELVDPQDGFRLALKWYHEHQATVTRRSQLAELIATGEPNDRFLWPLELVDAPTSHRFGYVMQLRPEGFVGLAALLSGRVPRNERAVVRFAFELALAFRDLHISGLCYRDINFGNAFMHPETGAALVCDNDNVGIEGVGTSHVRGTPKFWAPEVARDDAAPSKFTDRYSLAVMLFYLLVVHHPLDGARTDVGLADAEASLRHYVNDPLFCFDPHDTSNRPNPELNPHVAPMWNALPRRIRVLFSRSFGDGLANPTRRVVDTEWCDALAEMRSGLYFCSNCGSAAFLEDQATVRPCASCGTLDEVLLMRVNGHQIAVSEGATLTAHHVMGNLDFDTTLGCVERHPTRPDLYGLRIELHSAEYQVGSGAVQQVSLGERAGLLEEAEIRLGDVTASVARAHADGPGDKH